MKVEYDPMTSSTKTLKNLSEDMKKCNKILMLLKKHQSAGPFLQPVDPQTDKAPDYYDIVKEPIDLSTVERNLKNGMYISP